TRAVRRRWQLCRTGHTTTSIHPYPLLFRHHLSRRLVHVGGHPMVHRHLRRLAGTVAIVGLIMTSSAAVAHQTAHAAAQLPVTILGQWGSAEKTDFQAILSYCAAHYHTKTTYIQSGSDLNAQLSTMVQGNNAPDIA